MRAATELIPRSELFVPLKLFAAIGTLYRSVAVRVVAFLVTEVAFTRVLLMNLKGLAAVEALDLFAWTSICRLWESCKFKGISP